MKYFLTKNFGYIGIVFITIIYMSAMISIIHNRNITHSKVIKLNREISELKKRNIEMDTPKNELAIRREQNRQILIDSCIFLNSNLDPHIRDSIIDSLLSIENYNIPPLLILCLIKEESGFNPLASNKSGAIGLMQIIPKYHQEKIKKLGLKHNELFFIENNLKLGIMILNDYVKSKKTISNALQKYVGGSSKNKVKGYIHNIMNNYITLRIKYFDSIK